jgi:peptide/nickel transport system substrate-binding protein
MKSRTLLWKLMGLVILVTMVLSACTAPTAAPVQEQPKAEPTKAQVVEPTKAAEVKPTEAPVQAAAPGKVKDPIPYPEPNKLDVGGVEVKRQPISEIVTYKALPEYHQPAWMDKLVADGTLPAVKDRLPKEPQVYLTSGMKDGVGVYGDVWRAFSACPTAGWNNMASVSSGWFGIESYTTRYGSLVKTGPLYRVDQDIEPMPELAKSWDWSADGKVLTMHLIEGAKWSDGVPFTAEDVQFTWDAFVVDPNVNAGTKISAWTWDNVAAKMETVDDYTVKFTFPVAFPKDVYYMMDDESFIVSPKHILAEKHPLYSKADPKPTYKDFENAMPPQDLPLVSLGPWVPTEYKTDELLIMRRNPYYWKVDEAGNQLPYMDEIQYRKGPSGVGRDLCTIAGDCDHMNVENPSTFVEVMKSAQDPNAKFQVTWGPETLGYGIQFNMSADFGAQDDRDLAVRQLLRDVRFRKALSYATDREGIAQSIMRGPFLRAWAGGLYPGAPEFSRESVVYYPYDVESAKTLLADMGLKDTDNNGILNWTEGSQSGKDVILQINASEDAMETQSVAEAVVNQWAAVGIKLNYRILTSTASSETDQNGNWDMKVFRGGQAFALPFTQIASLAPIAKEFTWHREGDKPRQFQPYEDQMIKIVNEYRATFDPAKRKDLMAQYNKVFTENVYNLGVFVGRYGLGLAKRTKNVPSGTPAFMYTWVEDAVLLDVLWAPTDQQMKQNRPETIPVYKK